MSHPGVWLLLLLLAACQSEAPVSTSFDSSAGLVVVSVGSDGFVRWEGKREPLEACVLQLRQRTRAMTADQLARFVVRLRLDDAVGDEAAQQRAGKDMNRLLDYAQVMGVGQVLYQ